MGGKANSEAAVVERLVRDGCERNRICAILHVLGSVFADDSWEHLIDQDLRSLKATIQRIRQCAQEIERLNRQFLVYTLAVYGPRPKRSFYAIPKLLREYADELDLQRRCHGPKRHPMANAAKAHLVHYVQTQTKQPHDEEVSTLIAIVQNKPNYDAVAHRMWRRNHRPLLDWAKKEQQRANTATLPPPPAR